MLIGLNYLLLLTAEILFVGLLLFLKDIKGIYMKRVVEYASSMQSSSTRFFHCALVGFFNNSFNWLTSICQ